jgi:hypothetical protein
MKKMLSLVLASALTVFAIGCEPTADDGVEPVDTDTTTTPDTTGDGTMTDDTLDSTGDAATDAGDAAADATIE